MYHTLANPETVELTERNPNMKQFARELCHKFNLFVMAHDAEVIERVRKGNTCKDNPELLRRQEDRNLRLVLTKENGLPFCAIHIGDTQDRAGKLVPNYVIVSPIILKEKGRGNERMTRESIKIKALMKSLQKDYDDRSSLVSIQHRVSNLNIDFNLQKGAEQAVKGGMNITMSFNEGASRAILEQLFENKPLAQNMIDYLKTKYDEYQKFLDKKAQAKEIVDRFMTDCYLILRHDYGPAIVAKVNVSSELLPNSKDYRVKITIHDGMKCYSEMDSLAEDHPDLALSIKMFGVRHQNINKNDWLKPKDTTMFPITEYLPCHYDRLDADLDVLTHHTNQTGFHTFSNCSFYLTPVATHE